MASMTFNDVLKELLGYLRATDHPILIGWDAIQQWPESALDKLLQAGILTVASSAQSIECHACEKHCFMDVITPVNTQAVSTRAFIVCEDTDMQSQIGRVRIPLERLQQWQSSAKQLSQVIADLLGVEDKITCQPEQSLIRIGMLKSLKGRRWITLNVSDLTLVINQHPIQIEEVLYYENEKLVLDDARVNDLLNRDPLSKGKQYTPSTEKRAVRKLETQAMYKDWNDEYLRLKKQSPNKTKTSCAYKISKMDIAKDKSAGTIRKNLTD
tara:strand:- start:1490 stop:2296 length:807 start_codon:yes stop_codon:yes gene_type:complete